MHAMWPWITLILLGAYHGLNPGMGWLFAVTLGLQERTRSAVVRAFAPIALGHAASIAAVVTLVAALQSAVSPGFLRWIGAGTLIAFGLYKLIVPMSCPRWVGMRVGFRELTAWSFLMATACGAGLMVVPIVLKLPSVSPSAMSLVPARYEQPADPPMACHAGAMENPATARGTGSVAAGKAGSSVHSAAVTAADTRAPACHAQVAQMAASGGAGPLSAVAAVVLHTLAMFLVMALIALVVYEKIGLSILRRAWVNLDLLWAGALIGAGVLTFVL